MTPPLPQPGEAWVLIPGTLSDVVAEVHEGHLLTRGAVRVGLPLPEEARRVRGTDDAPFQIHVHRDEEVAIRRAGVDMRVRVADLQGDDVVPLATLFVPTRDAVVLYVDPPDEDIPLVRVWFDWAAALSTETFSEQLQPGAPSPESIP